MSGAAAGMALTARLADPFVAQGKVPSGDNAFSLGVASGDPLPDAVVIWTRLAPRPLEPFGGMEPKKFPVTWEVAEDDHFLRAVARGSTFAHPEYDAWDGYVASRERITSGLVRREVANPIVLTGDRPEPCPRTRSAAT